MNYYSSEDMVHLVYEINQNRMPRIIGKLVLRSGSNDPLSDIERKMVIAVRSIRRRFARGDLTHTDNDEMQIKAMMDWLITKHAEQNNHPVPKLDYHFDKGRLRRAEPLSPDFWKTAVAHRMMHDIG